ncbi:putative GTP-binding protein [Candidatus Endolissoclinum faulkneri L5]|uniref:Ribosome-binding ATPase YchF n=1 Tax=Candidatus Endolissoclinum faulkneri L5 TaxID=1401328 RepID=V9TUB2_9PROT|nr:redox-regulated ATPase YchF [Candidatus Endolissoclinum faulkneri]AHC73273.1 putative GTP-binding protein [Candidatus Endolissoclinum faulkneri L5]
MGFSCGIIGLPNVGKSTLFNALTSTAAAEVANYPFCTIKPNTASIAISDPRLDILANIANSSKILPARVEFIDIAGLVKGAFRGAGLGNQFLDNIRNTHAIIHVLRCFEGEITHVDGSVDPIRDAEIVNTELMLADLNNLEKRILILESAMRSKDKNSIQMMALMQKLLNIIREGKAIRSILSTLNNEESILLKQLQLLTAKPMLYLCNVEEDNAVSGNLLSTRMADKAADENVKSLVISAAIEAEIAQISNAEEKKDFLYSLNLDEFRLTKVIRSCYKLLNLLTFFTVGSKEVRAWTLRQGTNVSEAAGKIHSDFRRGFIRAETISFADFVETGGERAAKEAGKMRIEGFEYIVQEGDIFYFRFNI